MRNSAGLALIGAAFAVLAVATASADTASFERCVASLQQQARAQGISERVAADVLDDATRLERVVELDRAQPEFTQPFGDYLERRVTEERVERGRALMREHEQLLARIYRDYGVAPRYLVAFWGLETNFGTYFGEIGVIDSLATLACDDRRSAFFSEQLMDALAIIDRGSLEPDAMEGSWAGAMGHVQFMPSVFKQYAVDYDGDGKRDLWNSVPDALASAARFLQAMGWERGWRWGREVSLPSDFPYAKAGRDRPRPLAEWQALGVRTAYDRPLEGSDVEADLLLPSGHRGPAFLVYDNFDVIMDWNPSLFYALSVGHMADRLSGVSGLVQQPPDDVPRLSRDQVEALQQRLNEEGFEAGPVDGMPGPSTRAAIQRFQKSRGMIADGFPSRAVLDELAVQVAER
ncbi:MAG: lytic murein transglycosylase [Proteobacteria bacterium SW_6_67_9]|nr:MAG: lytic murein transglycosylase [Proteobacteria bacterium SW_6_67_9]